MCGIVGYNGKSLSRRTVLSGLKKLEYRGYDSAGFSCIDPTLKKIKSVKEIGALDNLITALENNPIDGTTSIGHIRWSTHGVSSLSNAHPQFDCFGQVSVVHNGIIENYSALKAVLAKNNHIFRSQTDTEIVAHLVEEGILENLSLSSIGLDLAQKLEGSYSLLIMTEQYPEALLILRKGSPLCIGIAVDEVFVASDPLAFPLEVKELFFLPDKSFSIIEKKAISVKDFAGTQVPYSSLLVENTTLETSLSKKGYEHFMLKEINEQTAAINQGMLAYYTPERDLAASLGVSIEYLKKVKHIELIGCGTSWHSALLAHFFIQETAAISCKVSLASEFRYGPFVPLPDALYIFITQSGETADTLEALRMVKTYDLPTIALVNVERSSAAREAQGVLLTYSGPEIAVASTKAFSGQIAALYWLAHQLAYVQGKIQTLDLSSSKESLQQAAYALEANIALHKNKIVTHLAPWYAQKSHILFLGRHTGYPLALEGALKLKEIAYIVSEAYPAGELKHGPIALIEKNTPVILFSCSYAAVYKKLVSNAQEIKARQGHLLVIAFEGDDALIALADEVIIIPRLPTILGFLGMLGIIQFLVYHIALVLKLPIDKPRNLAKSVTVE